jgi:hypothetical protein
MITPSFGLTATERVLPRLSLDFTTATLDPRVEFTRANANTATVTNSSGLIVPVAANVPRFDYDPITLNCKGLLIEESRSNRYIRTDELNNSYWTNGPLVMSQSSTELDPMGNLAWVIASSNFSRTLTVTASATNSFSLYVKAKTGTTFRMREANYTGIQRDYAVGTGVGVNDTFYPVGNGWYRCVFNLAYGAGQTVGLVTMGTVNGDLYVAMPQAELGFATSYMPNPGAGGNVREADVATMTGTNFSDWYNPIRGTLVCIAEKTVASLVGNKVLVSINDNVGSNFAEIRYSGTNTATARCLMFSGGADQFGVTPSANSEIRKIALAYEENNTAASANASTPTTDTSCLVPVSPIQMTIGYSPTFGTALNGWIRQIYFYDNRCINNEIRAFTN